MPGISKVSLNYQPANIVFGNIHRFFHDRQIGNALTLFSKTHAKLNIRLYSYSNQFTDTFLWGVSGILKTHEKAAVPRVAEYTVVTSNLEYTPTI